MKIGEFHIMETIGAGGFATVYRARDPRLEDDVAIKVLAENHALDPEVRERFILEAQALRRIDDDHALRIHDIGETAAAQPYLVMEYAQNGDLHDRAMARRRSGAMPSVGDVRRLANSLGSALSAIHAAGLIHRDVSPRNLLLRRSPHQATSATSTYLDPNERIILADLGFVKDLAKSSGLTVGGGTSGFSAPEQAAPSATIDERADVFGASAVVAWFILGEPPGSASSSSDLGRRLDLAGFPSALGEVLHQGMASGREDRIRTIDVWAAAVDEALAQPPAAAEPVRAEASRPLIGAGVLAGLVLGVLLGGLFGTLGSGTASERLDDGRVAVSKTRGDLSVGIVGPSEIAVGESAVFETRLENAKSTVWIAPDGFIYTNTDSITIAPSSPGTLHITLIGVDGHGNQIALHHEVSANP